jgi:hypothetical protein
MVIELTVGPPCSLHRQSIPVDDLQSGSHRIIKVESLVDCTYILNDELDIQQETPSLLQ